MLWWQGCGLGLRAHQMIEFAGLALQTNEKVEAVSGTFWDIVSPCSCQEQTYILTTPSGAEVRALSVGRVTDSAMPSQMIPSLAYLALSWLSALDSQNMFVCEMR